MERTNEKKIVALSEKESQQIEGGIVNFSLEQSLEGLYMIAFLNLDIVLMDFVMV